MITNPILITDSYKFSHYLQYPEGTSLIKSYVTARGTKLKGIDRVVFFGLQIFIQEILSIVVTQEHIEEAESFLNAHGLPFNRAGWQRIVTHHGGKIPVVINALPEGTLVPFGVPMVTVENTDSELPWVTSYIETLLLSYVWYGSTVATNSREIKKIIYQGLVESADDPDEEINFKLHDFGMRGAAPGASGVGAAAHLINFLGTDTVTGIQTAMKHYGADMCGFSISASEHSTITSWGRDGEYAAYKNMALKYKGQTFACVIDSYDTLSAVDMWTKHVDEDLGCTLAQYVVRNGGNLVLRPDSGDPVQTPIQVIERIMENTGYYKNRKGFKVIPNGVRVIQGDGIDIEQVDEIVNRLIRKNISVSNIAFGMGGALLQKVNRDTFKFAMKACFGIINDTYVKIQKDPSGDSSKRSLAGDLFVHKDKEGKLFVIDNFQDSAHSILTNESENAMSTVYSAETSIDVTAPITFDQVRKNAGL